MLSHHQFGLRAKHTSITAVKLATDVISTVKEGKCAAIFVALKSAVFDTISHVLLIKRLWNISLDYWFNGTFSDISSNGGSIIC